MSDNGIYPSLNEVSSLAKRAARGAGMNWGIAEEAANSVRWLTTQQLPGPALLAGLLDKQATLDIADVSPLIEQLPWVSAGDHVCPILAAAAFSDHQLWWKNPAHNCIDIVNLAYPLLMLPAVARVSASLGVWLQLSWDDVVISTDGKNTCLQGPATTQTASLTHRFRCIESQDMLLVNQTTRRQWVDRDSWKLLELYAYRSYAPATEESRRLGAGGSSELPDDV
ncbi:MAG: DUF3726 domain-containing protein [Granulosicoccus sp.]